MVPGLVLQMLRCPVCKQRLYYRKWTVNAAVVRHGRITGRHHPRPFAQETA
ncbi:hypothetical protein [Actinoplanes sp. N902-109]|uniref:hypothetical protein n=1 Tax=Actinoplanes sp. (strain N902-109) TaxID=649831 RepID=UPI0003293494|nr:hypothetical protein [Actinoplanes sp. N902-109]AGL17386.1 hypothetical protein L083_3876 [Actinoplanes sp. N902-109]